MVKIAISWPQKGTIFQRSIHNDVKFQIIGEIRRFPVASWAFLQYRWIREKSELSTTNNEGEWQLLSVATPQYSGECHLPAPGWYRIEIRIIRNSRIISTTLIEHIGVGEVFIMSGQSNSANSGEKRLPLQSDNVWAWTGKNWRIAADPQPLANGTSGSPWPAMGDILTSTLHMPIGLFSIGVGGTAVEEWLPTKAHFPRFQYILGFVKKTGVRAILWHQGESDISAHTSTELYQSRLNSLISETWKEFGQKIAWIIAQVGFHPDFQQTDFDRITKAQRDIADNKWIFSGPTTDDLIGLELRPDRIHMGLKGLKIHGERWANCLIDLFFKKIN